MHLFVFIYSLSSGGAERVTSNLVNYWAEKGWKITIVTLTSLDQDFYTLHPNIHRFALDLDANSDSMAAALQHNLRRVRALRNILVREAPDVALGVMSTASCLLALAAKGTNIPAIGSERIHPPMYPLGLVWEWLRRRTYPHLDAVVSQTEQSAQWLRACAGVHKVPVIPNPVSYPLVSHEPRVLPNAGTGNVRVLNMLLAVGRLSAQKGFDRLVSAFAELVFRFPQWRLVILGEGNCRAELEEQVAALALRDRVWLPGAVGNVGEWYESANLYVMASRFEGFPNTLLEALAYGVPAISVDCETGPRDIVRHEIDGLLVPQDNRRALVDALSRVMDDESLRRRYAARAIEVRDRFAIERVAGMWQELFEQMTVRVAKRKL